MTEARVATSLGCVAIDLESDDAFLVDDDPPVADRVEVSLPLVIAAAQAGSRIVAAVDRRPPLMISDDVGLTWREAGGGLPVGTAVAVDHGESRPAAVRFGDARLPLGDGRAVLAEPRGGADRHHGPRVRRGLVSSLGLTNGDGKRAMSGLDDLLKKATGSGGSGGLGDLLGSLAGGGADSELGDILGGLTGGGGGKGGGMGGLLGGLLPMVGKMLADGGLQKVLAGFQQQGLAEQASSWLGTGANEPISAADVRKVVSSDELTKIAGQLGISEDDAASALAQVLPAVVDKVSPDGQLPPAGELDAALGRLGDAGVVGLEPELAARDGDGLAADLDAVDQPATALGARVERRGPPDRGALRDRDLVAPGDPAVAREVARERAGGSSRWRHPRLRPRTSVPSSGRPIPQSS